jgi:hypothetical protein
MKCDYGIQGINIIYLDAPVGTGFSYSKSYDGYIMDDYKFVAQAYEFLQKVCVRETGLSVSNFMLWVEVFSFVLLISFKLSAVAGFAPSVSGKSTLCRW